MTSPGSSRVEPRDESGRLLLVRPTYKDYWDIPGGYVEPRARLRAVSRSARKLFPRHASSNLAVSSSPSTGTSLIGVRGSRPKLTVVLGAGALDRKVGGTAVMAGAFSVLDFGDPDDPPVVCLESHVGGHYLENENEVGGCRRIFDLIHRQAVPIEEYR